MRVTRPARPRVDRCRMRRAPHRCRCTECGDLHVRVEPPLARWCVRCFEWIAPGSRAKYCSPACRQAARSSAPHAAPGRLEPAAPLAALRLPAAPGGADPRPGLAAAAPYPAD